MYDLRLACTLFAKPAHETKEGSFANSKMRIQRAEVILKMWDVVTVIQNRRNKSKGGAMARSRSFFPNLMEGRS